jgi:outer membrane lipoprotein-sorting protein
MAPSRVRVLVLALALAVALAGCSFAPGGSTEAGPPPIPDGDEAASAYSSIGNVTGDMRLSVSAGNETNETTLRFAAEVATRNVRERVTSPARHQGNLFVSNETHYWRYNATRDVAVRYAHDDDTFTSTFGTGEDGFAAFLEAAFDAANENGTVSNLPNVGVGPAPTVASANQGEDEHVTRPTATVDEYVVSYDGMATVAGERTHVLVVTPANQENTSTTAPSENADSDSVQNLTVTYYVETERFFPVRVERHAVIDGEEWSHVMTFSNLNYGANLSGSTFTYEPDEGTDVFDYSNGVVRFPTRDALASNTSVPLPEPDLPDGYEFVGGASIRLNTTGLQVLYSNGTTALIAGRYVDDGFIPESERENAEEMTVNGHRALYSTVRQTHALYVYCGDYVVSGAAAQSVPKAFLVEFTASIACDGGNESAAVSATDASAGESDPFEAGRLGLAGSSVAFEDESVGATSRTWNEGRFARFDDGRLDYGRR